MAYPACHRSGGLASLCDALVEELRSLLPLAQRTAKKLLSDSENATLSLVIELEGQAYSRLRSSDDFREGAEAFQPKVNQTFAGAERGGNSQAAARFPQRMASYCLTRPRFLPPRIRLKNASGVR